MDERLRGWIADILMARQPLLAIAFRQRAKFEGWLKFEIAACAEANGATEVTVEPASADKGAASSRADLTIRFQNARYHIELKTPNCNWRLPGVRNATRPITKNIAEIVADVRKLSGARTAGLIAFALFPIPHGDTRWQEYLERISKATSIPLTPEQHTIRSRSPFPARRLRMPWCVASQYGERGAA